MSVRRGILTVAIFVAQASVIQANNEVDVAAMLQSAYHRNVFASARMERVSDQNIKLLFLGSISQSRKGR
jgi:hypothetical protein